MSERSNTAYKASEPKQFGTLHERMKYLVRFVQEDGHAIPHDVVTAIYDLETEVRYHAPAKPPFGRRMVKLTSATKPKKKGK